MKTHALFYICLLLMQRCEPGAERGYSNFELNNADGRYILTGLINITEGRSLPVTGAPEKQQLQVKWIPSKSVNNTDSVFLEKGYFFRFKFYDLNDDETSSLQAARVSVEMDDKHSQERQWLILNDSTGILVVLEQDYSRGVTTRLMISNVMNSATYQAELDTVRYIYRPKFN